MIDLFLVALPTLPGNQLGPCTGQYHQDDEGDEDDDDDDDEGDHYDVIMILKVPRRASYPPWQPIGPFQRSVR